MAVMSEVQELLEELRRTDAELQEVRQRMADVAPRRTALILRLHEAGVGPVEIARVLGCTHQRVVNILRDAQQAH